MNAVRRMPSQAAERARADQLGCVAPAEFARIGRTAVASLYREVALHPKPGLVSPMDSGAHDDMTMATFHRSLFSLRHYFPAIARAGAAIALAEAQQPAPAWGADGGFARLQALGVAAERQMLNATGGINTHRGAVFNLGLLCAAAGALRATGRRTDAGALCEAVGTRWGAAILDSAQGAPDSHGACVARRHGVGGARAQAAGGFADVRHASLPALRTVLGATGDAERAAVQALFVLVARLDDTNLLWRGGEAGLAWARDQAAAFLRAGGTLADDWRARALEVHRGFVARRLSPGGAADLLAVTLLLHALDEA